jgi:hypothetical protein
MGGEARAHAALEAAGLREQDAELGRRHIHLPVVDDVGHVLCGWQRSGC